MTRHSIGPKWTLVAFALTFMGEARRDAMIKGSWGKKGAAGAMSAVRSSVSGLFTGLVRDAGRPAKTSPGSALSQTERVTNALRAANKQTQTFKPKNAR